MKKCLTFISLAISIALSSACRHIEDPPPAPWEERGCPERTMDGMRIEDRLLGVHRLYPLSVSPVSKAPKGYKSCHISHYGRHGARFIQYDTQYVFIHRVLEKAYADGKLTPRGVELRNRYESIYPVLERRSGELCPLGMVQMQRIASRMTENYPGLFKGKSLIVANSTNLERTLLSMHAFCDRLHAENPKLEIVVDGARREMGSLNPHCVENLWSTDYDQMWKGTKAVWRKDFKKHSGEWIPWKVFAERIFTDTQYASSICDVLNFEKDLFLIASSMGCIPVRGVGFFDFFTHDELVSLAKCADNYLSYMEKGRSTSTTGRCWALCHTLLEDIITKADEDMDNNLGVRLRFGHDGCMMGLFVLMNLEGWNGTASNPDEIWEQWDCSRIPMASNLQMVLYKGNKESDPVLMTWKLNEEDMPLPLEEVAPGFYRWEDFKAKYLPVIAQARELLKKTEILTNIL